MERPQDSKPFATSVSRWFFGISFLLILFVSYRMVQPFLMPIFLAVVLAVVGGPVYARIMDFLGGRRVLSSTITVCLFIIVIVAPLYFFTGIIASQALDLYNTVSQEVQSEAWQKTMQQGWARLGPFVDRLQDSLGISRSDVMGHIGQLVQKISNLLYSNLTGFLAGITNVVIDFVLMLIVLFYLLMDGHKAADRLAALSPLPSDMNHQIKDEVLGIMRATLTGTVVLAFIQGVLGGLGFFIFGVPNAPFWGTVMIFASVIPLVGTAVIWLPAGLYLILVGNVGQAVGVMAWCLIAAVISDNFLRPRLIGKAAGLHSLLIFFSVLGGLATFGVAGLILGPMVLALLLSLIEVYRLHFIQPMEDDCPEPEGEAATESES